jgi:ribosome-associated protein
MADESWLAAGPLLRIPRDELSYYATRSGGPGGQHVNTSSTRIELWWNLAESSAPTEAMRALLRERLGRRVDAFGWLRLVESGSRSQTRNRETVTERFLALLAHAAIPPKPRRATRVPRVEKQRRLEAKRVRSNVKRLRGRPRSDD